MWTYLYRQKFAFLWLSSYVYNVGFLQLSVTYSHLCIFDFATRLFKSTCPIKMPIKIDGEVCRQHKEVELPGWGYDLVCWHAKELKAGSLKFLIFLIRGLADQCKWYNFVMVVLFGCSCCAVVSSEMNDVMATGFLYCSCKQCYFRSLPTNYCSLSRSIRF